MLSEIVVLVWNGPETCAARCPTDPDREDSGSPHLAAQLVREGRPPKTASERPRKKSLSCVNVSSVIGFSAGSSRRSSLRINEAARMA